MRFMEKVMSVLERRAPGPSKAWLEASRALRENIADERDILFGIALYFECMRILYDGQDALTKAYHDELLAIIRMGEENLNQAGSLLREGDYGAVSVDLLTQQKADALRGCPNSKELRTRAEKLVAAYARLFPGRSRERDLDRDEILRLLDAAALEP